MKNKKKLGLTLATLGLLLPGLASCGGGEAPAPTPSDGKIFHYEDISFTDRIDTTKTNETVYNYSNLIVNKVEGTIRDDFAYGVDASMVKTILDNGGYYYNSDGYEQDIWQILRKNGVNFVRFRLWNKPVGSTRTHKYGGGDNSLAVDLDMAKKARAANLNVMIDFHYSDFWADPEDQRTPYDWLEHQGDVNALAGDISTFTSQSLAAFKNQGVDVAAVQIGNEINNGMCDIKIDWSNPAPSMDKMASMLKAGIGAAKSVFPSIQTVIHLANGGNKEEFEAYFTSLDARGVNYDIIGASYYPHLSGSVTDLQANLDNVSKKTGKPVVIAETSWGFTLEDNEYTANTYSAKDEDVGGYMTSYQAQATCIRDICNVLSKVPEEKGLGIFYWEPAWLPVVNAGWATKYGACYQKEGNDDNYPDYQDGKATWSNQGLFDYGGKMLPSLKTYLWVKDGHHETVEVSTKARKENISITLNVAEQEKLPATYKVETNLDAIRDREVIWDATGTEQVKHKGQYTVTGVVQGDNNQKYNVVADARCIQNFVSHPGFEDLGETDVIKEPWKIDYSTPEGKIVKLDRKKDVRSGKTDLNWYCGGSDFTFGFSQTITTCETGTYTLVAYLLAPAQTEFEHSELKLFIKVGETETVLDIRDKCVGWQEWYQKCEITGIEITEGQTVVVGMRGAAVKGAWAHTDDWELTNTNA